jgi:hypothetical protein
MPASSVLPSPLPTRMSLHHLTPSHIPHISPLLLDIQRLSSVVSQASGMGHQAGLVLSSRTPHRMYISPDASMQTQAAGHRECSHPARPRYVALWSTVRAHRRRGRSLVQRPSHLDTPLAGPCKSTRRCWSRRLLLPPSRHTTQPMCLSLSGSCKPTCKALHCQTPIGEGGGCNSICKEARVDDASLSHHQGLLHALTAPSSL